MHRTPIMTMVLSNTELDAGFLIRVAQRCTTKLKTCIHIRLDNFEKNYPSTIYKGGTAKPIMQKYGTPGSHAERMSKR